MEVIKRNKSINKDELKGFIFLPSFLTSIEKLNIETQKEILYRIAYYGVYDEEPAEGSLEPVEEAIFELIKPNIASSKRNYKSKLENGKKGGRPKNETEIKPNKNRIKTETEADTKQDKDVEVEVDVEVDIDTLLDDFELIWKEYPRKEGKEIAFQHYKEWIEGREYMGKTVKLNNWDIWQGVHGYVEECEENHTETRFIKNASNFFDGSLYEYAQKYYIPDPKKQKNNNDDIPLIEKKYVSRPMKDTYETQFEVPYGEYPSPIYNEAELPF